ncbi:MAG TPA: hypothetical protein VMT94_04780 [Burkholderiales bacterium]|nr:hypothetical protein [Burkholderiales bacterium]
MHPRPKKLACLFACTCLWSIAFDAFADSYTAPSGYFQIIGYKLQLANRNGKTEIAVAGRIEALADCRGAVMVFDVLDKKGDRVGTYKITHGEFFRHDGWELGPGTFAPTGDAAKAMAAADHVAVREADCN